MQRLFDFKSSRWDTFLEEVVFEEGDEGSQFSSVVGLGENGDFVEGEGEKENVIIDLVFEGEVKDELFDGGIDSGVISEGENGKDGQVEGQ